MKHLLDKKNTNKIIAFLSLTIYILLIISSNINNWNQTVNLNWISFIFLAPFVEGTRMLTYLFPYSASYIVSFVIASFVTGILFKNGFDYFKKYLTATFEILKVFAKNSKNASENLEKYFAIFKKYDISFLKFICSAFSIFLYFFCISGYFTTMLQNETLSIMNNVDTHLLWFDLLTGETKPILFGTYVAITYGLSTIIFVLKYSLLIKYDYLYTLDLNNTFDFYEQRKSYRGKLMYTFLIKLSVYTLVLYLVSASVPFAIFILVVNLKLIVKNFLEFWRIRNGI